MKQHGTIYSMFGFWLLLLSPFLTEASQKIDPSVFGNINIKSSAMYQTNGLMMLETDDGDTYLATADGRFLIKNPTIYSTFNAQVVNSIAEFKAAMQLTLNNLHVDPETDLLGYSINPDAKEFGGTLFISPRCPYCKKFTDILRENYPDKRFFLAFAPILSKEVYQQTIDASCSADPKSALQAVYENHYKADLYPVVGDCKKEINLVNKTIAALQMLSQGTMGVPTFTNDDGVVVGITDAEVKVAELFAKAEKE
ncbi:thioredoxin fold domain-containing protein (plasmid) [Vibrio sp. SS-MA-C1-2]|uniref:thioredoxin fold domain-containing protein n=1 Tax=Vibrio sp. SS-MA-C1-2 TaxID=2908646 RepID=UPI001F195A35|nr:thioredoxin fold domain-containing protein [Vibrio sp. SS-MA-C1-2]UJF20340.1 thioredoxin fold domain-containing protein [Vibrio sp. SS-MA-C1-2]